MSIITGLAIYFILWWLVLFTVLPWGAGSHYERDEDIEPGTAPSAPVRPRLALKFAITSFVAAVLFGVVYAILVYDLIQLEDIPFLPTFER